MHAGRRASAPETPRVPRTLGSAEKRGHARVAEVHEPASLLWLQLGLPLVVKNIGGVELPGVSSRGATPEGAGLPACAKSSAGSSAEEGRLRDVAGSAVESLCLANRGARNNGMNPVPVPTSPAWHAPRGCSSSMVPTSPQASLEILGYQKVSRILTWILTNP